MRPRDEVFLGGGGTEVRSEDETPLTKDAFRNGVHAQPAAETLSLPANSTSSSSGSDRVVEWKRKYT